MKMQVFVLAACLVTIHAYQVNINNNGYYWRDWKIKDPIPADAVDGGFGKTGHETFIARTVYQKVGVIVPGKVSEVDRKMWFEFDNLEHESTDDIHILCLLNHRRFHWVPTKLGDDVDHVVNGKELVLGGHDRPKPVAIGRKWIGDELHIGKVLVNHITNKFVDMRVTKDGKGWGITDSYEVLVYDHSPDDVKNIYVNVE